MEEIDRLFVNLTGDSFDDFVLRGKRYEVRAYDSRFNEKTVFRGRRVEFRKAYSRGSIWTMVGDVFIGDLMTFLQAVNYKKIEPRAESREEAIAENARLLKNPERYVIFEVKLNRR
jgi:coproporphyrinogen III oxidase